MKNKSPKYTPIYKMNKIKQYALATKFSEGKKDLKFLLLTMWKNHIDTYACCGGHEIDVGNEKNSIVRCENNPYIYFDVSTLTDGQLSAFLAHLFKMQENNIVWSINYQIDISDGTIVTKGIERHGLDVQFNLDVVGCFKELKETLENVLQNQKIVPQEDLNDKQTQFIDLTIALNNINLTNYHKIKTKPNERFGMIDLTFDGDKTLVLLSDSVEKKSFKSLGNKPFFIELAEGYITLGEDGKYYSLLNGKPLVVDLNSMNLPEINAKYNTPGYKDLSYVKLKQIIKHIEDVSKRDSVDLRI